MGGCEGPGTVSGVAGSSQLSLSSEGFYSHAVVLVSDDVVDDDRSDKPCPVSALASPYRPLDDEGSDDSSDFESDSVDGAEYYLADQRKYMLL